MEDIEYRLDYNIDDKQEDVEEIEPRDKFLTTVKILTLSLIFFMTLTSNSLVLVAVLRGKKVRHLSRIHMFVVHLSIADILVALLNIFPQLAWDITITFKGGYYLCKFVKYAQVFVLYLSTYILTGMSLDRVISMRAISTQWKNGSGRSQASFVGYKKIAKLLIIGAWGISAVLAGPQLYIFSYNQIRPGVYECWADFLWSEYGVRIYVTMFVLIILGLPVIILTICYGWIVYIIANIHKHQTVIGDNQMVYSTSGRRISRAKIKTIQMTLVIVICFVICWTPFCAAQIYMAFFPNSIGNAGPAMAVLPLLASLNSCVNPWIYAYFSSTVFRRKTSERSQKFIRQTFRFKTRADHAAAQPEL